MSQPKRFLHQKLDEEEVWVDLKAGRFYGLNETGVAILEAWRAGVREPGLIAERLAATFEVSATQARPEVEAFLAEAATRGFLEA